MFFTLWIMVWMGLKLSPNSLGTCFIVYSLQIRRYSFHSSVVTWPILSMYWSKIGRSDLAEKSLIWSADEFFFSCLSKRYGTYYLLFLTAVAFSDVTKLLPSNYKLTHMTWSLDRMITTGYHSFSSFMHKLIDVLQLIAHHMETHFKTDVKGLKHDKFNLVKQHISSSPLSITTLITGAWKVFPDLITLMAAFATHIPIFPLKLS